MKLSELIEKARASMIKDFTEGANSKGVYHLEIEKMTVDELSRLYNSLILKNWSNDTIELMFNIHFYSKKGSTPESRKGFFEAFGHTDLRD